MIDKEKLIELVKAIESPYESENPLTKIRKNRKNKLNDNEIEKFTSYLLSPYENGYWELKSEWNFASKYSLEILSEVETLDTSKIDTGISPSAIIKNLGETKCEELLRITSRLSPVFSIFRAATEKQNGNTESKFSASDKWARKIDLDAFINKFPEAYNVFSEEIYFKDIEVSILPNIFHKNKSGITLYTSFPRNSNILHIISTDKNSLSNLKKFYEHLGVIENSSFGRVFSPDEILFKPYFHVVSAMLPTIFKDNQISILFEQALDYYERNDFQHCISRLGLIAEDYLQRIYTTLFREKIPTGLTLGQTLNNIYREIDKTTNIEKPSPKKTDIAYKLIDSLQDEIDVNILKNAIRELLAIICDDRGRFEKKLEEIKKPNKRRTPFPSFISENIDEILKWRNAASHNTRVALGTHEADRTLYCVTTLIAWWQQQILEINWENSKIEILEFLITKSKENSPHEK